MKARRSWFAQIRTLALLAGFLAWCAAPAHAEEAASSAPKATRICGWFENPTPGNASITDRSGEWTIAMQGAESAEGDWPRFAAKQWVKTGIADYGYGCACMDVLADATEMRILSIRKSSARALSACRRDKHLVEPESH